MMNRYINILFALCATLWLVASCEKDDPVTLDPEIETWEVSEIDSISAVLSGFVVSGLNDFTEYGVAWDTSESPTIENNSHIVESKNSVYTDTVTSLEHLTTYYVRAYGKTKSGETMYGDQYSFTTTASLPYLKVDSITNVTDATAKIYSAIPYDGKSDVTARGICYSMEPHPMMDSSGVTTTTDGEGDGIFITNLDELVGGTTYYVKAYGTNAMGTSYSVETNFTTKAGKPIVYTDSVSNITKTEASVYGNIMYTGGADITERGFSWGTSSDDLANDVVISGTGTDTISATITSLDPGITYYVAAYAENSNGRAYGDVIEFTTEANIWKFWVVGDYNSWDNNDNAKYIISTSDNTVAEGYVYFPSSGAFKLATDHSWDAAYTYGDDGSSAGILTNPGENIAVDAGYYHITADGIHMEYSITNTTWGVIGSATPNGWDSDVNLTYNTTSNTWRGVVHLTSGEYKFRANDAWDLDYGSTAEDETLDAGGKEIAVAADSLEADYDITLDLSTPNAYTYMAHRWGVVGDATPGGWNTDTNLTWDETNQVFTVTLDLVIGALKFRANDAWDVNLGGDIGALTQGGDNISISTAGNYTITLNTMTNVATVTQN